MILTKFTKQKTSVLSKNQPDLLQTISTLFPEYSDNEEQLGKIAGIIIEYVIQSGGNVEIFGEDLLPEQAEDEFFETI
jgi:hypothetical protein